MRRRLGLADASAIARRWRTRSTPGPPSNAVLPGPAPALPSAPVFAAEPMLQFAARPPAMQPPAAPNLRRPAAGADPAVRRCAAVGAGVAGRADCRVRRRLRRRRACIAAQGGTALGGARRCRRCRRLGLAPGLAGPRRPAAPRGSPSDADFASLACSLGRRRCRSFAGFDARRRPTASRGDGLSGPAMGISPSLRRRRHASIAAPHRHDPSPRSGVAHAAAAAPSTATACPIARRVGARPRAAWASSTAPRSARRRPASPASARSTPTRSSATSRSCASTCNGKPLVWLDNAATTQKPQSGDRPAVVLLRARELQHPPRRAHAGGARDRRLRGGARQGARASSTRRRPKRSSSCAARPRASTSSRRAGAAATSAQGDEIVITHLEHHANIVPWQQLCRREGRQAARRAGRRHAAR